MLHLLIIKKLMIHALLTVLYLQMQWIGELCFLLSFLKKMTMENTQFVKPQELNLQTQGVDMADFQVHMS